MRRLALIALLGSLALTGCGRHHRQELQGGGEPPLVGADGPGTPPIVNRESPAVLRWAGGD